MVPLSLQLLLENAVKHNQVMPSKKLHITISEENGNLVVTNNSQPKQVLKESTGVGLRNIRDRYALLTKRPVIINENRKEFSIAIPILGENIQIMNTSDIFISEKKYKLAKKRVEQLKGFLYPFWHLSNLCSGICVPELYFKHWFSLGAFPYCGMGHWGN